MQSHWHRRGDGIFGLLTTLGAMCKGCNKFWHCLSVIAETVCGACRLLLPTVVFCFSKKRVDALADNLSRLDLSIASEKSEVTSPRGYHCCSHSTVPCT